MNKPVYIHPVAILASLEYLYETQYFLNQKRTVGCLLGSNKKKILSCNSSFRIPFEEDNSIWFIDHSFIDKMLEMHKKINKRETLIGWYSSCNKILSNDQAINRVFYPYTEKPILVLIKVDEKVNGLVLEAYVFRKNLEGSNLFQKKNISIGMLESEDIGVHQMLRDTKRWTNSFKANVLTNWYQIFTSFSKCFRGLLKKNINSSKYNDLRLNLFLIKKLTKSVKDSQIKKINHNSDLILLYFLNSLKLTIRVENILFRNII